MNTKEIKEILDEFHEKFNNVAFIEEDPILIPHGFSIKEDIEIAGFLSSILAWGQRKQIIQKANLLMDLMDNSPFEFVTNAGENELDRLNGFYYRTFQAVDALFFIRVLRFIYCEMGGLESVFTSAYKENNSLKTGLEKLFSLFESTPHQLRSMKHIANVRNGSSAKRINMFLRWMVRKDKRGVDFGLWEKIPPRALYLPLDVHTGRTARKLGLLIRKQDDWKSVEELTSQLKVFDAEDPIKYDFALFGASLTKII